MKPYIGRIIHVRGHDRCIAAIITGNIRPAIFDATIFTTDGPATSAARRIVVSNQDSAWHDPSDCPNAAPASRT